MRSESSSAARGGYRTFLSAVKESCRKNLAGGLYYSGMLGTVRRLERSHELSSIANDGPLRLRRFSGSKFGILCYHRVGTVGVPFHSTLNPQLFDAQIRYVKKHYRVVPIAQLCSELACGRDVSPTLAITFDDGYRDLYLYAFPVLKKYGIPATIYLIGRCVETGEAPWYDRIFASIATYSKAFLEVETDSIRRLPLATPEMRLSAAWEIVCYLRSVPDAARQQWCFEFDQRMSPPLDLLEKRMLDWSQIKTMHGAGVSFGAHTMNHPAISRLEPAAYDLELATCKSALERGLGVPVDDFAYPFGKLADGNNTARQFLERTGYRSAVTTIPGFNSFGDNPHMLRRLQINSDCSLPSFAFNLTRMFVEAPEEYAVAQDPAAVRSESRGLLF